MDRSSTGKSDAQIVVVDSGKTAWSIVCATPENIAVNFAVRELRKYMERISGCDIPVAPENLSANTIVIALRKDLPPSDQALLSGPAKGYDGYSIAVTPKGGGRIVIGADNGRGAIYAVYDLLERLGCRWFYPALDAEDPEVVPRLDTVRIPVGAWSVASPMRIRLFASLCDADTMPRMIDWGMKTRYNTLHYEYGSDSPAARERDFMGCFGIHAFGRFLPTEDYFAEHPEWFGMQGGKRVAHAFGGSQFCWSNREAQRKLVDNLEAFILKNPGIDLLTLCGGDGLPACTCPECMNLNPSDWALEIINLVAESLERVAPHVIVESAGAYPPIVEPPLQVKPHPRVRLHYAHWGRSHIVGYDSPLYDKKADLDKWCGLFDGRMTVFQYYCDQFAEPWIPPPYAIAIIGDRKYLLDHGSDGILNLNYPHGYWWSSGLNMYLAGLCFYDASLDPFDLIRDHAPRYFGPEAGALLAAYYEEWAREPGLAYRVRGGATDADSGKLAEQRRKWIDPAIMAVRSDGVLSRRVAKIEKMHSLAEQLVTTQLALREIERLRTNGDFDRARKSMDAAKAIVAETRIQTKTLIDLNQGLADEQLPSFFYPRFDAQLAAEEAALEEGNKSRKEASEKPATAIDMVPEDHRK